MHHVSHQNNRQSLLTHGIDTRLGTKPEDWWDGEYPEDN